MILLFQKFLCYMYYMVDKCNHLFKISLAFKSLFESLYTKKVTFNTSKEILSSLREI